MRSVYVLTLANALALVGCVSNDLSTSSTSQHATTKNRLSSNRLSSNRLSSNRLSSNSLAPNLLSVDQLLTSTLLQTVDGRTLFSYVASCALPDGVTLEAVIPGAADSTPTDPFVCSNGVCDFAGSVGLTPTWATKTLGKKGQGWISACLLARVNAHDTAESISLRGPNDALVVAPDEALLYTVEEGAFYGNVFTKAQNAGDDHGDDHDSNIDPDDREDGRDTVPHWYTCMGEGQASGEFGGLVVRDCTEPLTCSATQACGPDPSCTATPGHPCPNLSCNADGRCANRAGGVITQCGFTWTGFCADFTPQFPSPYACESFSANGYYEDCHDSSGLGKWKHSREFDQVITTFVTP